MSLSCWHVTFFDIEVIGSCLPLATAWLLAQVKELFATLPASLESLEVTLSSPIKVKPDSLLLTFGCHATSGFCVFIGVY